MAQRTVIPDVPKLEGGRDGFRELEEFLRQLKLAVNGLPTSGGGAPLDATFITRTANATLTAEQAMGALTSGLVKNTTVTGVQSIASAGTDYSAGTSALATGLLKSTTGTGALSIATPGTDYLTSTTGQAAPHFVLFVSPSWPAGVDATKYFTSIPAAIAQAVSMGPGDLDGTQIDIIIYPGDYSADAITIPDGVGGIYLIAVDQYTYLGNITWEPTGPYSLGIINCLITGAGDSIVFNPTDPAAFLDMSLTAVAVILASGGLVFARQSAVGSHMVFSGGAQLDAWYCVFGAATFSSTAGTKSTVFPFFSAFQDVTLTRGVISDTFGAAGFQPCTGNIYRNVSVDTNSTAYLRGSTYGTVSGVGAVTYNRSLCVLDFGHSTIGASGDFLIRGGTATAAATEVSVTPWIAPRAGEIKDLQALITTASGAGKHVVLTVRVNGVDTALICTIADPATTGSASSAIAIAAGDQITIRSDFNGTNPGGTAVCLTLAQDLT